MNTINATFVHERETKGAHRFQEVDAKGNAVDATSGAAIGTLYIRKDKLDGKVPTKLEVSIKVK